MSKSQHNGRRKILVFWKSRSKNKYEVFSNLKHFTRSYPEYCYNSLNNYLSRTKKAYETDVLCVELILGSTKTRANRTGFKLAPVVQKRLLCSFDESKEYLDYWLSRSVKERAAAITFIISQSLQPGEKLDKTAIVKRKI